MNLTQTCTLAVALGLFGCGADSGDTPNGAGVGGSQTSGTGGMEVTQSGSGGSSTSTTGGSSSSAGGSGMVTTGGVSSTAGGTGSTGGTPPVTTGGTGSGGASFGPGGTSFGPGGTSFGPGGTSPTGGTGEGGDATGGSGFGGTSSSGGTSSGGTAAGGAGTGGSSEPGGKFVGNITSSNGRTDSGSLKFADYWNQVSPQNEGKWGSVSNARGQYNWSSLDTMHDYAKANNMVFKEHTFIWGPQQPTYGINESDVKDWMTQFCARYTDVAVIDVVNEPPPHTKPSYEAAIGGGTDGDWAWITNAFKWADEACPNAVLVLNDFNNLEWDGDSQHFIDIVNTIKQNGAPIDAIGCQAHDLDHLNGSGALDVNLAGVTTRLNNLIAALPTIYITEMDISTKDDAVQLDLYKQFFTLFWENPNVKGITIWGWVVGQTWSMAPDSGLITSSGTKRPAFTWLLDTIGRG